MNQQTGMVDRAPAAGSIPPERLYFAIIDAPGFTRRGPLPAALAPQLEEQLPVASDDVHAVGIPLAGGKGRMLVVAIDESERKTLNPHLSSLSPTSWPASVSEEAASVLASSVNLLVGDWEPAHVAAARGRRSMVIAVTALLCCAVLSFGLLRRTGSLRETALQDAAHADKLLNNLPRSLTGGTDAGLRTHVADQQRRAGSLAQAQRPSDVTDTLEKLLNLWPRESSGLTAALRPNAISIGNEGIRFTLIAEGDPAVPVGLLKAPPGYVLSEPQISAVPGGTGATRMSRIIVHMRPAPAAASSQAAAGTGGTR